MGISLLLDGLGIASANGEEAKVMEEAADSKRGPYIK